MGFPDKNVISKGASVRMQLLADNGSRPSEFTLTLGVAAAQGANQLSLTSSSPCVLQHNEALRFVRDTWQVNLAEGYQKRSNGIIIDGGTTDPSVGDKIRFENHATVYTVASYANNVLGLNPTLRQAVGDNTNAELLVEAIVDLPQTDQLNDVIAVGTAATNVRVTPLSGPIAINAVTNTFAMRELLGLTDASPTEAPQTQDATDHKSALIGLQKTVTTIASKTVAMNGNRIENDRCIAEVLMPVLNDPDFLGRSVWLEVYSSDGDYREGVAQITDSGSTDTVQNLRAYNFTATFNSDFTWISGDEALYQVAA